MTTETALIVGAHFHPPAKALLNYLPLNCPLILRREPHNAHDPNAIAIIVEGRYVPDDLGLGFDAALSEWGTTAYEQQARTLIDLGYIPRAHAAQLVAAGFPLHDVEGHFGLTSAGLLLVRWETPK